MMGTVTFRLATTPIDIGRLRADFGSYAGAGAFASFEGWVRDTHLGRAVRGLSYEANETLATSWGCRILEEVAVKYALLSAVAVHRTGDLDVGEVAVWVGVCAPHRDAAFTACREALDRIKVEVPIWKLEHYTNNEKTWILADVVKYS